VREIRRREIGHFLLQDAGKGRTLLQILSMRSAILTLTPVLLSATLSAQGVFSNKTQVVLEKVIQDYPNHFYNIKGELISQALQSSRYRSTLQLPGAESTVITVSSGSRAADWSCVVLETKSFTEAKEKFATIYGQLSNSIITAGGQKTFILSGQYEAPAEDKKSTCIIFSLLPGVGEMKKIKVELTLRQEQNGWKIQLSVDDKEEAQGALTSK
jgi:hypothetical protein